MKNLLILVFMLLGLAAFSQRTLTIDTIMGAETVNFETMSNAKVVTATCTQTGGTSDGTLTLYGSTDNSTWVFLNFLSATFGVASPKASITGADLNQITITDALVCSWVVTDIDDYKYYRVTGVGTTGDTTKIVIIWSK